MSQTVRYLNGSCGASRVGAAGLAALLVFVSCTAVRQIRPLDKGESSAAISLGGPFTQVGSIYIPLPLLSASYHRGILDQKLDWGAGLHITQALYGVMMLDGECNWRPWQPSGWRPGLIATPRLVLMSDFSEGGTKIYPDACFTFAWRPRERWFAYAGLENWFELSRERDDGLPQENHWLIAPYVGTGLSRGRWDYQFEGRLYTPNLKNSGRPTKNPGVGDRGIWGVFLSVSRGFGGGK